jgi:exopolyphosphatase/pppGpp-phosphohydrolase
MPGEPGSVRDLRSATKDDDVIMRVIMETGAELAVISGRRAS